MVFAHCDARDTDADDAYDAYDYAADDDDNHAAANYANDVLVDDAFGTAAAAADI
jgi:hypothetical protein